MPYDGLAMHVAARELHSRLAGGRIDRVNQPEKDEIHLQLRSGGTGYRLVLSAGAGYPRVHLTGCSKANPLTAPMFCMALRKHLVGGRVRSVAQYRMERVLEITVDVRDELGVPSSVVLRAEIMGRHSNLILTGADGRIIESIKHISEEKSRVREVLPGLAYAYPPEQDKENPLTLTAEELEAALAENAAGTVTAHLSKRLAGLSAATLRALLAGCVDPDAPLAALDDAARRRAAERLYERFAAVERGDIRPVLVLDPDRGEAGDFFPVESAAHPGAWQRRRDSLQEAMDEFYLLRDRADRIRERTAGMHDVVRRNLERCRRKLEKQRTTLEDAANMERYRLFGELLTGNLHALKRGMRAVSLPNWYDPEGAPVEIPLDPTRDGSANAQQYFKKYRKARVALELTRGQMEDNGLEIEYLEGQLHNLSACRSEADVQEIREELIREGYMKPAPRKDRKDLPKSAPLHYRSSDGYDIYVGRNNLQNDTLTLRFARGDDMWMHTRQIPGSHVIVRARDGQVSDTALSEGALLAAWHSQARNSSSVPVDYTKRRNVKKPGGARPGYVIYSTNRTATVTPDAAKVAAVETVEP